jgi:molecular chaperone Hsp33
MLRDMSREQFRLVVDKDASLAAGVAITTEVCRTAQRLHGLESTSCIALGRLLTAAALSGLINKTRGALSLQVVCEGRLGNLFADIDEAGHLRGYVKNPSFDVPVTSGSDPAGRRNIDLGVRSGVLSVIRLGDDTRFHQSTTELVSGEIDLDVEHYLQSSDQIPTVMSCDVLLGPSAEVRLAGGIIVQALPGGDTERLEELRARVRRDFPSLLDLDGAAGDALALLGEILPSAREVENPVALEWRCRCSYERVRNALAVLDPAELAQMVDEKQPASVRCDFCSKSYVVPPEDIEKVFLNTITARG